MNKGTTYIGIDSATGDDFTTYCVVRVDNHSNVVVLEQDTIKHGKMYVEKREAIDKKVEELKEKYNATLAEMQPFPRRNKY